MGHTGNHSPCRVALGPAMVGDMRYRKHGRTSLIRSLFQKQRGKCYICGEQMTLKLDRPNTATVDHVVPRSKALYPNKRNRKAACFTCNNAKADQSLTEYMVNQQQT